MKIHIKKRYIAAAVVNAAVLAAMAVLTAVGSSMAKTQSSNMAARRWGGDEDFTQMSCFFSEDAGFSTNNLSGVYGQMLAELKTASVEPEDGKKLIPQAYSTPLGKQLVTCDITGRSDADVTVAGGDFFLFHDFRLLNGSYFRSEDTMQDGAVIDKTLAWRLYGSTDIAGKNIYINNVKLYVSGVIDVPDSSAEEKCIGDLPKAYISYETAGKLSSPNISPASGARDAMDDFPMEDDLSPSAAKFTRITCYECILPEPVSSFAENTTEKIFSEAYRGKIDIVNNTERFEPKKRAKAFGKLYKSVIKDSAVCYPFWENASRIVEFRLSCIYGVRRLLMIIPVVTGLWLLVKGYLLFRRKKHLIRRKISALAGRLKGLFRYNKKPAGPDNAA